METNKKNDLKLIISAIIAIIIIAVLIAIIRTRKPINNSNLKKSSSEDIKKQLNIDIKEPEDANSVTYDIENDSMAKVTYTKTVSDGVEMNFILRSSYSLEEDLTDLGYEVQYSDQAIHMTTTCEDGVEIDVESYLALGEENELKYMRAVWFDNDKYYSMVTDNLYTREDFLQEVNRVIIANHIPY